VPKAVPPLQVSRAAFTIPISADRQTWIDMTDHCSRLAHTSGLVTVTGRKP